MCDADARIMCTIHTNVQDRMDVCTVQIKSAIAPFLLKMETVKENHEKKENENQKADNKAVSFDAAHH